MAGEDAEGDEMGDDDPPLETPVIVTGWPAAAQPLANAVEQKHVYDQMLY